MEQRRNERKDGTVGIDEELNACNLQTCTNLRNYAHANLCVCSACGPRPAPQGKGGGRRLALKGGAGGGAAERKMQGRANRASGRGRTRTGGASPPDDANPTLVSVKRSLNMDLEGARNTEQEPHPAKCTAADGLNPVGEVTMETGADQVLTTVTADAAASGDTGGAPAEKPVAAAVDTDMTEEGQPIPLAEPESSPAPASWPWPLGGRPHLESRRRRRSSQQRNLPSRRSRRTA